MRRASGTVGRMLDRCGSLAPAQKPDGSPGQGLSGSRPRHPRGVDHPGEGRSNGHESALRCDHGSGDFNTARSCCTHPSRAAPACTHATGRCPACRRLHLSGYRSPTSLSSQNHSPRSPLATSLAFRRATRAKKLNSHEDYLLRQWIEGCHNGARCSVKSNTFEG